MHHEPSLLHDSRTWRSVRDRRIIDWSHLLTIDCQHTSDMTLPHSEHTDHTGVYIVFCFLSLSGWFWDFLSECWDSSNCWNPSDLVSRDFSRWFEIFWDDLSFDMLYLFWYVIFVLRCCFLDNSVSGVYICAYLFSVQWCVVYICVPVSYHLSLSARLTHWHTIVCSSPLLLSIHWLWHVSMTLVYTVRYMCFSHLSMTLSLRASQCGGELRVTAQHRALAHCSALTALLTCAHCSADTHTHTVAALYSP